MWTNKIWWISGLCALALLGLVAFQLHWLNYSKSLVAKQFDQKVTMALCSVAEQTANEVIDAEESFEFLCQKEGANCGEGLVETTMEKEALAAILERTFAKYDIDLEHRFQLVTAEPQLGSLFPVSTAKSAGSDYSCSIGSDESQIMKVDFLGRDDYIRQEIGWMTMATILLLSLVVILFAITLYHLFKQKALNQWNIDFFNNMAHEFRTPLTNTQLALNLLDKKEQLSKENNYYQIIHAENRRLLEQVERVLHISSFERGDFVLKTEKIDVNQLLGKVVEEMQLLATHKGGRIHWQPAIPPIEIIGDSLHISNALRNVIDNAIKYSDGRPEIDVQIEVEGKNARLSIRDNGIGIENNEQKTIFQRFYRITKGNQHNTKGFGLGLAYVKNVVEKHAGFLSVDSMPQQGSTFNLFFPLTNVEV